MPYAQYQAPDIHSPYGAASYRLRPHSRDEVLQQMGQRRPPLIPGSQPSYNRGFEYAPNQGMGQPTYSNYGGGGATYSGSINDPTLAPGASYSGTMGSAGVPPGAIPIDPFNSGNINLMVSRGFRKKYLNGSWYWLPPLAPGTQQPSIAQPY